MPPAGVTVTRIVANSYHNAFTSLLRWRGDYYLAYREAHSHTTTPPGRIIVLRSPDGVLWHAIATIATGGDDRDPRLFATADALGMVFGTYYPAWAPSTTMATATHHLQSHIVLSPDGEHWGVPCQVYRPNYWLWSIMISSQDDGTYYAAAYHFGGYKYATHSIHLLASEDLVVWREIAVLGKGWQLAEPVLFAGEHGLLSCLIRQDEEAPYLATATPPYSRQTNWTLTQCDGHEWHPSAVLRWDDGWLVAARQVTRPSRKGKTAGVDTVVKGSSRWQTVLLACQGTVLTPLVMLPSGGDCAYAGLAWTDDPDVVLVSYYSQHERREPTPMSLLPDAADIYVARVRVRELSHAS